MNILILYLVTMNMLSFWMMAVDKSLAGKRKRRIPENRLFILSLGGGALGTWIGMKICRHKTKHMSFVYGIPALLVINIMTVYFMIFKFSNIF